MRYTGLTSCIYDNRHLSAPYPSSTTITTFLYITVCWLVFSGRQTCAVVNGDQGNRKVSGNSPGAPFDMRAGIGGVWLDVHRKITCSLGGGRIHIGNSAKVIGVPAGYGIPVALYGTFK
jgi:hypothetical protein